MLLRSVVVSRDDHVIKRRRPTRLSDFQAPEKVRSKFHMPTQRIRQSGTAQAYPACVVDLMEEFAAFPGIGRRTAERMAFHILKSDREDALRLARSITDVKNKVRHCPICFNFTEAPPCAICSNPKRDHSMVLVVEEPKDVIAIEQTGMYRGDYHVLLGRIAPLDGIAPEGLTIDVLLKRIDDPAENAQGTRVREVILGLSPNLEGDGTAMHLMKEFESREVKVTRLARGLPSGSQIEYANKAVLADALVGRVSVE